MRKLFLLLLVMLSVALAVDYSPNLPSSQFVSAPSVATTSVSDTREPESEIAAPAPPAPRSSQPESVEEDEPIALEPESKPEPQVPSLSSAAQIEAEVLRLSNIEREKAGLNSLSADETLAATARAHSADMIARDFFAHDNPDGCSSSCRVTAAGYRWQMIGENIYMMSGWDLSPQEAAIMTVNGWLGSPGHRENLLKQGYTESGIGVVVQGDAAYATALYAKPR